MRTQRLRERTSLKGSGASADAFRPLWSGCFELRIGMWSYQAVYGLYGRRALGFGCYRITEKAPIGALPAPTGGGAKKMRYGARQKRPPLEPAPRQQRGPRIRGGRGGVSVMPGCSW